MIAAQFVNDSLQPPPQDHRSPWYRTVKFFSHPSQLLFLLFQQLIHTIMSFPQVPYQPSVALQRELSVLWTGWIPNLVLLRRDGFDIHVRVE